MYLGFWRLNTREALPLLGVALKYASEVSKSGGSTVLKDEERPSTV